MKKLRDWLAFRIYYCGAWWLPFNPTWLCNRLIGYDAFGGARWAWPRLAPVECDDPDCECCALYERE